MLFKQIHLIGIRSNKITLAFRRWQKASVKTGSLLHTAIGLVEIRSIETVNEKDITDKDALSAGYADKDELLRSFTHNSTGTIFRISVGYHSADPRIKLREQSELSEPKLADLQKKLERLDSRSREGPWTRKVLLTIKDNPHLHAIGIAKLTGLEKDRLKLNIRKLKNLGLTISHSVGYELSPLGKSFTEKLTSKQ